MLAYELPYEPTGPGVEHVIVVECYNEDGGAVPLPVSQVGGADGAQPILPNPLEVKVTMVWTTDRGRPYSVSATTRVGR